MLVVIETTLPFFLMERFGFSADRVALYVALMMGPGLLISLLLLLLPENTPRRYLLIPSGFVLALCFPLIGLSRIFSLPQIPSIIAGALALLGVMRAFPLAFSYSQVLDCTRHLVEPGQEEALKQTISALRAGFLWIGLLTGSLFGPVFGKLLGFSRLFDVMGLMSLLLAAADLVDFILSKRDPPSFN